MQIERLEIPDVVSLTPSCHSDDRGFFSETFRADWLKRCGIVATFVQDNQVFSAQKNVLRGLHFQTPPHAQGKLVRCVSGTVLDVSVDIRMGSPTFGHHVATELSRDNRRELWVPPGFAHGYVTLTENCDVFYKVTDYYAPDCDRGLLWNDPALGIDWKTAAEDVILSVKDRQQPRLSDIASVFRYIR